MTLAEFSPALLSGADRDLVDVVVQQCEKTFEAVLTDARVLSIEKSEDGVEVTIEKKDDTGSQIVKLGFSRVLAATGRRPNTDDLGLAAIGLDLNEQGLIPTDEQCRTAVPHIFAIGDVALRPGPGPQGLPGGQGGGGGHRRPARGL